MYPTGLTCRVGGHPDGSKDPTSPLWRGITTHNYKLYLLLLLLYIIISIIHWGCMDLQQLNRRTRKLLSMHGVHHIAADVDRLYAPCSDGGRGLQQIESTYQSCIVRLNCYLDDSSDPFMQMIQECESGKSSHSIKRMACRFTAQLRRSLASDDKLQNLHRNASISVEGGFKQATETDARHYCMCCSSLRVRSWSEKSMHGQYHRLTEQPPVDMKETRHLSQK